MRRMTDINAVVTTAMAVACLLIACTESDRSLPSDGGAPDVAVQREDAGVDASSAKCPIPYPEVKTSQLGPDAKYGQCEPGCNADQAVQFDPTKGCGSGALLCFQSDVGGGAIFAGCYKNAADSRIVRASEWLLINRPGWVRCDPAEEEMMRADCPRDAGAD